MPFDMDDELEAPSSEPIVHNDSAEGDQACGEHLSEDEDDGGPDWTKMRMASGPTARPIIPKRGEKDFEPKSGSNLQQHLLERMRSAMFSALDAERTISIKAVSYGIWFPRLARAHVTTARGIHFATMGYSVPRPIVVDASQEAETMPVTSRQGRMLKRLELLPEEALYLVERGSMFCWKEEEAEVLRPEGVDGTPMTVQQAYAEMIGREGLTLEKYQVYAYLKRLGFVVTRTQLPDQHYPIPAMKQPYTASPYSNWYSPFAWTLARIYRWVSNLFHSVNWMKPISVGWPFHRLPSYSSIYSSLRLIPSGHTLPLYAAKQTPHDSPYKIFYNLYKPNTTFKKTSPPQPDFSVVVIDARTTPMPTLNELTNLFDILPETPLPPLRRQRPNSTNKIDAKLKPSSVPPPADAAIAARPEPRVKIPVGWFKKIFTKAHDGGSQPPRRPNPFAVLKAGKKIVVIAAVDAGMISFFRLGQGEFSEWPMM